MTFNDGDEICGPNSYKRIDGYWVLSGGVGREVMSDGVVTRLLQIQIPIRKENVSKKTKNSGQEVRSYYVYKESE